jgi:hypothetical protein
MEVKEELEFEEELNSFMASFIEMQIKKEENKSTSLKQLTKNVISEIEKISNPIQLSNVDYLNLSKKFNKNIVNNYIKRGSEINSYLRGVKGYQNMSEVINEIKGQFQPLNTLLKNERISFNPDDYLEVYRYMRTKYDDDKTQGFMSTSNKKLVGFGRYCLKILVPVNTQVIIADISKDTSVQNTFEIILPNNTRLFNLYQDEDECSLYSVR